MAEFLTAREAVAKIPDHSTIGLAGMGLSGWAEEIGRAIRDSYKETGHPADLNLKQGSAMGDWHERGTTVLGEAGPGCITKWTAAITGSAFALRDLADANELECHCLPQGEIVNLWREIGARRPGLLSKVGLGTFIDPRVEGGRMNDCAKEELVKVVNFEGEEYLFYKSFKLDVAILRGTIADENGNISFAHESVINEGFAVANAAKACGGIVIVQVEYLAKVGTLNPKDIKIPGVLVDYVVVTNDKSCCWQTEGVYYEPAFNGDIKIPLHAIEPLPFDERKVICRRCAMELKKGDVLNLGVGMPADVSKVVAEEGLIDQITPSTESGMIGGVPAALPNFGSAYNPDAIVEHNEMFDMIHGGFLDVTVLGIGEIDEEGNNNVSKFGKRANGPGGFIDITASAKKVIFCGTFTGKSKEKVGDGKVEILDQGKIHKFVKKVQQITFAAKYARPDQEVYYITERAVFKLIDGRITLIEIAPGLDLQKDILDQMDFVPTIAEDLKTMDAGIFNETWGGLKDYMK